MSRSPGWFVPLIAAAAFLAACGGDATGGPAKAPGTGSTGNASGTINVFAAASLTDAFQALARGLEATQPGMRVEFNFAGSSALREQILAGAPGDVFASANEANMQQVVDSGAAAGKATPFVTNRLQIAVPAGNPGKVTGLADFARSDLLIGLCAAEVPCGEFGREALRKAGVDPSVDTDEADVRSLLTKVEAGELDAGLVYRTDVLAAGDKVEGIDIPPDQNVVAVYPIAILAGSKDQAAAHAFVAYVLSVRGQSTLRSFGFGPPT